jgi:FkbM family methyltransferase
MRLRSISKKVLPELQLVNLKRRTWSQKAGAWLPCGPYRVRINDGPNFYMLCKDLFVRKLYHFEAATAEPRILDCGGNIGMSVLYFKQVYPGSRIVVFEPDPAIFPYLDDNVRHNQLDGVEVKHAALGKTEGTLAFYSDGLYGSCLAEHAPAGIPNGWTRYDVPCVRLSTYLNEPVDMLKMNIEGAERDVINECAGVLRNVREIVIEYHHLPGLPRTLHEILSTLHEQGFEYLINDFDSETNPGVKAPFELTPESRYFLLIYARRID